MDTFRLRSTPLAAGQLGSWAGQLGRLSRSLENWLGKRAGRDSHVDLSHGMASLNPKVRPPPAQRPPPSSRRTPRASRPQFGAGAGAALLGRMAWTASPFGAAKRCAAASSWRRGPSGWPGSQRDSRATRPRETCGLAVESLSSQCLLADPTLSPAKARDQGLPKQAAHFWVSTSCS